jgi:hypothetical protein
MQCLVHCSSARSQHRSLLPLTILLIVPDMHCIAGGISRYHLEPGGDITWNVGTGYFGCRDEHGQFSADKFTANATRPQVLELTLTLQTHHVHACILFDSDSANVAHERYCCYVKTASFAAAT